MNDDLISRQAAIDAMNARLEDIKLTWRGKVKKGEIAMYLDMRGAIETLPSAQPERKKGKWILLSEKVPEMDERVIVINNGYEYHVWDCMSNRGDEYFWEDEEGLCHNKYEVMAWLPFPEVIL